MRPEYLHSVVSAEVSRLNVSRTKTDDFHGKAQCESQKRLEIAWRDVPHRRQTAERLAPSVADYSEPREDLTPDLTDLTDLKVFSLSYEVLRKCQHSIAETAVKRLSIDRD